VAKKKQTVARRLFEFAPVLGGRRLVTVTAGPGLESVLLSLDGVPDERLETDHGNFPKNQADAPNRFRVHYRGDDWGAVDIATRTTWRRLVALDHRSRPPPGLGRAAPLFRIHPFLPLLRAASAAPAAHRAECRALTVRLRSRLGRRAGEQAAPGLSG
jgi:hypothetical protein